MLCTQDIADYTGPVYWEEQRKLSIHLIASFSTLRLVNFIQECPADRLLSGYQLYMETPGCSTLYLTCDLLSQEEILVEVYQTFGQKIHVDKTKKLDCLQNLELVVPNIISEDPSSHFQLLDAFPKLYERVDAMISVARASFQHEPLIVRPPTQSYVCDKVVVLKLKSKRKNHLIKLSEMFLAFGMSATQ